MTLDAIEQITRITTNVITALAILTLATLASRYLATAHRNLRQRQPQRTRNRDDLRQPQW